MVGGKDLLRLPLKGWKRWDRVMEQITIFPWFASHLQYSVCMVGSWFGDRVVERGVGWLARVGKLGLGSLGGLLLYGIDGAMLAFERGSRCDPCACVVNGRFLSRYSRDFFF